MRAIGSREIVGEFSSHVLHEKDETKEGGGGNKWKKISHVIKVLFRMVLK
jgi:hypothetical protein